MDLIKELYATFDLCKSDKSNKLSTRCLERGDVSSEQVKRANQLARQIEDSANYQQNIKWELEDTRDEETKFSAVDESANAEGDPNRYVPPSLRQKGPPPGHLRQNSGPQKPPPPTNQRANQQSNKTKSSEKEARKASSKEEILPQRKQNLPSGWSSLGAPPGITAPLQPSRSRNWAGVAGGTGRSGTSSKIASATGQNAKTDAKLEDLKTFSNNFNLKRSEAAAPKSQLQSQGQLQSPVQQKDRKNRNKNIRLKSPARMSLSTPKRLLSKKHIQRKARLAHVILQWICDL